MSSVEIYGTGYPQRDQIDELCYECRYGTMKELCV
jgi:hypothetical protein